MIELVELIKSVLVTWIDYSVVELLIQICGWQLLSIANYRLDKVEMCSK